MRRRLTTFLWNCGLRGKIYTEVKRLGILLADLAAAVVGFLEPVARHLEVLEPDVEDRLAQLALEQCGLLDDDVVDFLLGRDDGLSRRVDGEAGVDGGRGGAADLPRVEAKAAVPERAEHPPPGRGRPPLEQRGALETHPMVADAADVPHGGGGVGEPRRRCSYEYDGHIFATLS